MMQGLTPEADAASRMISVYFTEPDPPGADEPLPSGPAEVSGVSADAIPGALCSPPEDELLMPGPDAWLPGPEAEPELPEELPPEG